MINYIINYAFSLLDMIVFTILLTTTMKTKVRGQALKYISPLIFSIFLFLTGFISSSLISLIMSYFVLFLLVVTILKDRLIHNLFTFLSLFITLSILDMITVMVMTTILNISFEQNTTVIIYKCILWLASRIILFFVFPKINFYFNVLNILKGKTRYSLLIFFLFDISIIFLSYTVYYFFYTINFNLFILIMVSAIILFNYLLNNLLHKIHQANEQEKEWERIEESYRLRLNNIEQEHEYIDQFLKEKHDFKQHLQMILAYISTDRPKLARDYIFTLTKKIDNVATIQNSSYPEILSFVQYKINIATNKEIEVQKDIRIPNDLFIDTMDLTIIIGNIMDNAIEANAAIDYKKKIILKVYEKNEYLLIHTENPYKEIKMNTQNKFITTKDDKINHGIGLQNIQFIVQKYNGFMDIDTSNEIFVIKIALENAKDVEFAQ